MQNVMVGLQATQLYWQNLLTRVAWICTQALPATLYLIVVVFQSEAGLLDFEVHGKPQHNLASENKLEMLGQWHRITMVDNEPQVKLQKPFWRLWQRHPRLRGNDFQGKHH